MRAPKILPWVASKAGISNELALNLWRRAAGESEELTGCCDSSDYYRLAVERFIDLAQEEGEKCRQIEPLSVELVITRLSWMRRYQERLWQINLISTQHACRLWHDSWMDALKGHKQAA